MHHGQRAICRVSGYTQDSLRPFWARQVPTNGRMRRGRQALKFDERRTTYDERLFTRPSGPNINGSLNIRKSD